MRAEICVAGQSLSARSRLEALRALLLVAKKPGAQASLDATELGKKDGEAVVALDVVDVFDLAHPATSIGAAPDTSDVLRLLEQARVARDAWPLVLVTDNGSPMCSKAAERFLEERGVLHLENQPRTPQHDSWIERENREIKGELALRLDADECWGEKPVTLGRSRQLWEEVHGELDDAPRWRRGGNPTRAHHSAEAAGYDARRELADEVRRRLEERGAEPRLARQRRRHERDGISAAIQLGRWIRVSRGGRPEPWPEAERIT